MVNILLSVPVKIERTVKSFLTVRKIKQGKLNEAEEFYEKALAAGDEKGLVVHLTA